MKLTRIFVPAAVAVALVLTGCSSGGNGGGGSPTEITVDASGKDCVKPGDASKAIKVEGDFGKQPKITAGTPVKAKDAQRTIITKGSGDAVKDGSTMTISVSAFNGDDGKIIESADASGQSAPFFQESVEVPFSQDTLGTNQLFGDMARCANEGQRAVGVIPVSTLLAGQDISPADAGLPKDMTKDSSVIVVLDTVKVTGAVDQFEGCEKLDPRDDKYPEVDLGDGSSEPKITIPKCMEAPKDLEVKVLKQGDGDVVKADENIMTNYVGVEWNGAERFDGNWSKDGVQFSTAQGALIEGFTQAMVGQKIGSTILVTIPPELAYGVNSGQKLQNKTLTFVLQLVKKADS